MSTDLLEIQPRELEFTFELKKQSQCSVRLVNKTNFPVAFKVKTTSPKKYCVRPNVGIVEPKSACDFTVTMQAQRVAPPDLVCKDKFLVQSTIVPEGTTEEDIVSSMFTKDDGRYVEENKLKVALVSPRHSPVLSPVNGVHKQMAEHEASVLKDQAFTGVQFVSPLKKKSFEDLGSQKSVSFEEKTPVNKKPSEDVSLQNEINEDITLPINKHSEDISVQNYASAKDISLQNNKLNEDISVKNHDRAKDITLQNSKLSEDISVQNYERAKDITLPTNNHNEDIGLQNNETVKDIPLSNITHSEDISLQKDETVKYINMQKNETIEDISLQKNNTIEDFYLLNNNSSKDINLQKNNTFEDFYIPNNNSSKDISLQKNNTIEDIFLANNNTSEDISLQNKVAEVAKDSKTGTGEELAGAARIGFGRMKDMEDLDLVKDINKMKSKLDELDLQLSEAKVMISKLTEEKRLSTQERESLRKELAMLKTKPGARRVQVGFPLLFVVMVALISITLGYLLRC